MIAYKNIFYADFLTVELAIMLLAQELKLYPITLNN